jgi:hypothetical protein
MRERKIGMCRPIINNKNLIECLKSFEVVDMRNLTKEEEQACQKGLDKISEYTGAKLFEDNADILIRTMKEINFIKDRSDIKMENCKRECYWNCDGQCCPEDEESFNSAKPNSEECTTFLRKDFDDYFWNTYDYILGSIQKMNIGQLEKVKDFITNQPKENK